MRTDKNGEPEHRIPTALVEPGVPTGLLASECPRSFKPAGGGFRLAGGGVAGERLERLTLCKLAQ